MREGGCRGRRVCLVMRQLWQMQRPLARRGQHAETQSSHGGCDGKGVRRVTVSPALVFVLESRGSSIEVALLFGRQVQSITSCRTAEPSIREEGASPHQPGEMDNCDPINP